MVHIPACKALDLLLGIAKCNDNPNALHVFRENPIMSSTFLIFSTFKHGLELAYTFSPQLTFLSVSSPLTHLPPQLTGYGSNNQPHIVASHYYRTILVILQNLRPNYTENR